MDRYDKSTPINSAFRAHVGAGTYTANTGWWVPAITAATNASPIVITTALRTRYRAAKRLPSPSPTLQGTPRPMENGRSPVWTTLLQPGEFDRQRLLLQQYQRAAMVGATLLLAVRHGLHVLRTRPGHDGFRHLGGTSDIALTTAVANASTVKIYTTVPKYMDYADNPHRPRHQFWFGPHDLDRLARQLQHLQRFCWPGNVHEAQAWACKIGIQTAIDDIKNNHPNDFVGMTFFSSPSYGTGGGGQHNTAGRAAGPQLPAAQGLAVVPAVARSRAAPRRSRPTTPTSTTCRAPRAAPPRAWAS